MDIVFKDDLTVILLLAVSFMPASLLFLFAAFPSCPLLSSPILTYIPFIRGQIQSPCPRGYSRLRPASLWSLAGWYGNPMSESTISRQSGTKNLATGLIPVSSFSGLHLEHSPSSPSNSFKSYRYCTGVFI